MVFGLGRRGPSTAEIDEFSRGLVRDLTQHMARGRDAGNTKKVQRKLARALDSVYAQARAYGAGNHLGVYAKARVGNTFKWELKELGFAVEFIEEATRGLILAISGK